MRESFELSSMPVKMFSVANLISDGTNDVNDVKLRTCSLDGDETEELPADSQHHPSDAALLHHPSLRGEQDMPSPRDVPELQAVSANADEHSMEACPSFDVQTAPSDDIKAAPHAPRAAAISDHPSLRKTNSLYLVPPMFKVSDETEPVTRSTGTDGPQPRRTQSYSGPRTVTSELTSANSFKV